MSNRNLIEKVVSSSSSSSSEIEESKAIYESAKELNCSTVRSLVEDLRGSQQELSEKYTLEFQGVSIQVDKTK